MPPKGSTKTPPSAKDATASGLTLISSFFGRPAERRPDADIPAKKRGRPSAPPPRSGRPAQTGLLSTDAASPAVTSSPHAVSFTPAASDAGTMEAVPVPAERVKLKRINWSAPEHMDRLRKAVEDWDDKAGEWLSLNPNMSFHLYCSCVGIPKGTLHDYAHPDESKRKPIGVSVGRPQLIDSETQAFAIDVLRRRDRGNDGMNNRDAAELLHDLQPELKLEQVTGSLRKTLRPNNKKVLTSIVKAQASTCKRSQITVAQQYRWHYSFEAGLQHLRRVNTGLTPDGKTFGEVIDSFVCGGDETCFLASAGDVTILGDKSKRKHEIHSANSRVSTTIYRTGFASGVTGPTGFLPPGSKDRKLGYTNEFLERHGAAKGGTAMSQLKPAVCNN